jgi:acyl carrier protein
MNSNEIKKILHDKFLISEKALTNLKDTDNLFEQGLLDSFAFIELLVLIGEKSNKDFDFSKNPPDTLTSINEILTAINKK